MSTANEAKRDQQVRETVREGYSRIAEGTASSCCGPSSCCSSDSADDATRLALAVGYEDTDLSDLPEGANMGLSCGNPVALASLQPGQVVVDLGSGGGFDVFIAGRRVGPAGRVIGVDMTPEMLARARRNMETYVQQTGMDNVEFRLGEIEHLPVADGSVDVVISNCVINLSPEKEQVWGEIARILKPGGRVAVSDMALLKPLPAKVQEMVQALVGCVAGAVLVDETRRMVENAGLEQIRLEPKLDYVDSLSKWNDPLYLQIKAALPGDTSLGEYITSLSVTALKPAARCCG